MSKKRVDFKYGTNTIKKPSFLNWEVLVESGRLKRLPILQSEVYDLAYQVLTESE
jgi:hypothetical protein